MIRDVISNDGFVISTIFSLITLIIAKNINRRKFSDLLRILNNSNYFKIYKKEHQLINLFDSLLLLNFGVNCSAFVYVIYCSIYEIVEIELIQFIILFFFITVFILLKSTLQIIGGYVLELYEVLSLLVFQQISTFNFIGVLLIPINLLLVFGTNYNQTLALLSIILVCLIILIGIYMSIRINQKLILGNILYFILYICTLEIGPFIIIFDQIRDYNL